MVSDYFSRSNPKNLDSEIKRYDEMLNYLVNASNKEWRRILDDLDRIPTFRVSWINYGARNKYSYPYKYVKKKEKQKPL